MDTQIIWLSPFPVHLELSQHCLATPWTLACQAPLSMRFRRKEYWSGLTFPLPWDLPDPRIEPASLVLQGDYLLLSQQGSPSQLYPSTKQKVKKVQRHLGQRYSHRNILSQLWKEGLLNKLGDESEIHLVVSDSFCPHGRYSPQDSPGQNIGVGSLSLLQGIFPTQGSNPGLQHCRRILYQLSHKGSPNFEMLPRKCKQLDFSDSNTSLLLIGICQ